MPPYDRAALEREMELMPEWFCERHLRLALDAEERALLDAAFEFLTLEALAQPVVFVHRDYHSRNLHADRAIAIRASSTFRTRSPGRSATTWCRCSRTATSTGRARGSSAG